MVDPRQVLAARTPVRIEGPRPARIALAHDWLVGLRGGERVLDRIAGLIAREHQPAGLYSLFAAAEPLTETLALWPVTISGLSRAPARARRWLLPLYPRGAGELSRALARAHEREPIDVLISSSSGFIKGVRAPRGVPHVCYCHSPPRYLWSQEGEYARAGGMAMRAGLRALGPRLRRWDVASAAGVTHFIANSAHTRAEIARCYGRESEVIHPPVRTGFFTPDPGIQREDFWLVAGALEPYKRTELVIEAARRAGAPLVVAGEGSMRRRLERAARGRVRFVGRVSDEALRDLFRRCGLFVFPQVEDFGITLVEALACGAPVLARRAGGAAEILGDGASGAMFDAPTPEAIADAARGVVANSGAARAAALRFSEDRFDQRMRVAIAEALAPA